MTASQLPEGRYGPRRGNSRSGGRPRWALPLGLLLAMLAGLLVAVIGYRNLATTPVQSETLGFTLLGTDAVQVHLNVIRQDPTHPAVCIVRARSQDGTETGRKEVYVPAAQGPIVLTTLVHTSRPPVAADVYGCSLQVPVYLVPASGS